MRLTSQTRGSIPLIAIGVAAALFLIISYQYSAYTLAQINYAAIQDIHSTTQIQIDDTDLNAGQNSTKTLTADYFWVGPNGSLLLLSNGTALSLAPYKQTDYSQRPYFVDTKDSGMSYYGSAVPSLSNASVSHVFVA